MSLEGAGERNDMVSGEAAQPTAPAEAAQAQQPGNM